MNKGYKKRIANKLKQIKNIYGIFALKGIGPAKAKTLIKKNINLNNFKDEEKTIKQIHGIGNKTYLTAKKSIPEIKKKIDKVFNYKDRSTNPPNKSYSNFITNKKQGDWAEKVIYRSFENIIKYGRYQNLLPEDKGFNQYWKDYHNELQMIGKRPDLLLYSEGFLKENNNLEQKILNNCCSDKVKGAKAAIEVRSSAYLTKENNFLSITPKLEDLILINKWIQTFGVEHYYLQVFFNAIYLISFENILDIIINIDNYDKKNKRNEDKKTYELSREVNNQFKSTYYIDVRFAELIGNLEIPKLKSDFIERKDGSITLFTNFKAKKARIKQKINTFEDNNFFNYKCK